jgi:hypothetical protein
MHCHSSVISNHHGRVDEVDGKLAWHWTRPERKQAKPKEGSFKRMYMHQQSGIQYHQDSMMSLVNAPSEIEPIQAETLLSQPSLYGKKNCYKNMQWDFLLYVFMK